MTRKLVYVLTIILTIVIVFGIVIGIFVLKRQNEFSKDIKLSGEEVGEELDVSLEGFYPGRSLSYTVNFGAASSFSYDVVLSFVADGDCALAEFIVLNISLNGEEIAEGKLSAYIGGESCAFTLPKSEDGAVLKLEYTMPEETGNEAQGTTADFKVQIEAKSKA